MTDTELVKRLRRAAPNAGVCLEAAYHISILEGKVEKLRAENERLRKALEPFANAAAGYDSFDGQHDYLDNDAARVTVGNLRSAALAMEKNDG